MTEHVCDVILNGGVTEKPVSVYTLICKYKYHYSSVITFAILAGYHRNILNANCCIRNSISFMGNGMILGHDVF